MTEPGALLQAILARADQVRGWLGAGLPEPAYEAALAAGLDGAGLRYRRPVWVPLLREGASLGACRVNFVVEEAVAVGLLGAGPPASRRRSRLLRCFRALRPKASVLIDFAAANALEEVRDG